MCSKSNSNRKKLRVLKLDYTTFFLILVGHPLLTDNRCGIIKVLELKRFELHKSFAAHECSLSRVLIRQQLITVFLFLLLLSSQFHCSVINSGMTAFIYRPRFVYKLLLKQLSSSVILTTSLDLEKAKYPTDIDHFHSRIVRKNLSALARVYPFHLRLVSLFKRKKFVSLWLRSNEILINL